MINLQEKNKIISFLKPYEPSKIALFGSRVRGDNREDSDLDVLVDFKIAMGLIQFCEIEQNLSEQLGIKVDLVSEEAIQNKLLRQYIDKDLIVIYND